jgi:hypothetical protein
MQGGSRQFVHTLHLGVAAGLNNIIARGIFGDKNLFSARVKHSHLDRCRSQVPFSVTSLLIPGSIFSKLLAGRARLKVCIREDLASASTKTRRLRAVGPHTSTIRRLPKKAIWRMNR